MLREIEFANAYTMKELTDAESQRERRLQALEVALPGFARLDQQRQIQVMEKILVRTGKWDRVQRRLLASLSVFPDYTGTHWTDLMLMEIDSNKPKPDWEPRRHGLGL